MKRKPTLKFILAFLFFVTAVITKATCPVFTFSPSSLTPGTADSTYSQTISASGTAGTVAYSITSGALPTGLTLSGSGALSGTPTATGTFSFTVTATDSAGCTGSQPYSLIVNCGTIVTAASNVPLNTVCAGSSVILSGSNADTYSWSGGITDGLAFVPTETTTYTVTGTAGSCSATFSLTVTVNPLPVITGNATATTVCRGTAITLTGSGDADVYHWNHGALDGLEFIPNVTGTYIVTGTISATGCTATATTMVTVNPTPAVGISASATSVCAGSLVTLTGGGADTYVWDNSVVDGVAFMPTDTTTYLVTGTITATGCSNMAIITVDVNELPIVTASSNAPANPICAGSLVTLTGGGADTYVWDNGVTDGVATVVTDTTTYLVTGTITATGCSNTAMITVNVNALPAVTASSNAPANTVCAGSLVTLTGSGADTYVWDNSVTDGIASVVTDTTMYTVTGTDTTTGCSNTAMITVFANALPVVTAASDAPLNTACAGSSVTLSGTGADNYTWDNSVVDGVAFTVSATADYIVTGTSVATGCLANDTLTITVNPLPVVDLPAFTGMLCDYSPVLALSGTPAGGTFSGTSITADSFDPTIGAGMYLITYSYTDANGCANSDTSSITVDVCTGIAAISAVENVMVYPNPSNGAFTVEFNQAVAGKVSVKITDLQGKLIAGEELSNFAGAYQNNFDLSSFNKGMYLLEVTGNSTHFVSKVILK